MARQFDLNSMLLLAVILVISIIYVTLAIGLTKAVTVWTGLGAVSADSAAIAVAIVSAALLLVAHK